jgi:hypothetical protein
MAIDPRIAMGAQAPNLQTSLKLFQDTLNNIQNRKMNAQSMEQNEQMNPLRVQEAQQVVDSNDSTARTERQNQYFKSVADTKPVLDPLIQNNDTDGVLKFLEQRRKQLVASNTPTETTDEAIQLALSGDLQSIKQAYDTASQTVYGGQQSQRQFAPEISPVQADPNTGQQYVVETDKNTGQSRRVDIPGAIQRTGAQTRETEVKQVNALETEKGKVARSNDMLKGYGDRNRASARAQRPLKQALTLIAKADQGVTGSVKLQLAKLIPGIDVSDEGQLDAVFNQLALEQLQLFSGPTTDFEFAVTQDIAGSIGNAQTANLARVKSLDRNNWFNQREFTQFNNYIKNGNDPDGFAFNFQETLKTKKGDFTLQQLQDTAVSNNLTIEEVLGKLNNASN